MILAIFSVKKISGSNVIRMLNWTCLRVNWEYIRWTVGLKMCTSLMGMMSTWLQCSGGAINWDRANYLGRWFIWLTSIVSMLGTVLGNNLEATLIWPVRMIGWCCHFLRLWSWLIYIASREMSQIWILWLNSMMDSWISILQMPRYSCDYYILTIYYSFYFIVLYIVYYSSTTILFQKLFSYIIIL